MALNYGIDLPTGTMQLAQNRVRKWYLFSIIFGIYLREDKFFFQKRPEDAEKESMLLYKVQ